MEYNDIIARIVNNDLQDDITQLTDAMHAKVYYYNGSQKLIIKMLLGDQLQKVEFISNLFEALYNEDNLTNTIYEYNLIDIKEVTFTYIIQNYLKGSAVQSYPNDKLTKRIVDAVYNFTERMREASGLFTELGIPHVLQILEYFLRESPDSLMKEKLKEILKDPKFITFLSNDETYLFHGDLWRKNIIVSDSDIGIIDLEPLFFGPKSMQLAVLLSAYFLLTKRLIDGNDHIDFNYIISLWHEEVNKEEIYYQMMYFPLYIGLSKEQAFINHPVSLEEYENIMGPLFEIIDWVQKRLKK